MSSGSYGGTSSSSTGNFGVYSLDRTLDFNGVKCSGAGDNNTNQGGQKDGKQ